MYFDEHELHVVR